MFQGDIPNSWQLNMESDTQLTEVGDVLVFEHQSDDVPLECRVEAVQEESDRIDFLGEVVEDGVDEPVESLWLSSNEYPTVSHTREEILEWVTDKLSEYEEY